MRAEDLLKLSPAYQHWVDGLLAKHESSSRPVSICGFQQLPQFFSPETFAAARYVEVDNLPNVPWHEFGLQVPEGMDIDFDGVTFRNTYFILHRAAGQESLHFHEMVHVVQWQILGNDLFPLIYALEAFGGSYSTNFLEYMACNVTTLFEEADAPFRTELFVAANLGQYLPAIFIRFIKGEL
ncbi:MAG: hypothetical protein ABSG75_12035 [Syntrophales bacterium]|jgi:hypothetical protein